MNDENIMFRKSMELLLLKLLLEQNKISLQTYKKSKEKLMNGKEVA